MLSPIYCSPLFHPDPGTTQANTKTFYLVTSPAAGAKRGAYPSWVSAQRVAESIVRGGAVKYTSWQACLSAWHACCDAGEHDHPSSLDAAQSAQLAPVEAGPPATPRAHPHPVESRLAAVPLLTQGSMTPGIPRGSAVPSPTLRTPHTPCAPCTVQATALSSTPSATYAVRGSSVMHSSLNAALDDFRAAGAARPVTLCTTDDPRIAAYFAAGHSLQEATALAQGDSALDRYNALASGTSNPRRERVVAELQRALHALTIEPVGVVVDEDASVDESTSLDESAVTYAYDSEDEYWRT
ncbi:hypothetical protein GGX14DRAFT_577646 [Mycena pura]|uniref:Uncharacterized protein n=1 Tax=Mycena pura TaxID=153505 RepID=A0AAD6Y230_9AGAR|nr:hypothetical protein GGX14DRAFT_577646 [Mycena pura]